MLIQVGAHGMRMKRLRVCREIYLSVVRLVPFDLERDSDSLLAGSGLHQIEFDLVLQYGAYSVYFTAVRTPY